MNMPDIIYEDNHIIAINKHAGELSQSDSTGEDPLQDTIKSYIRIRDAKPGNVYLGTIHRLDKPVTGVILFAKTSKAATRLTDMMKSRSFQKYYLAVSSSPKKELSSENWIRCEDKLYRDRDITRIASEKHNEAQHALLDLNILASVQSFSLVCIDLLTGRKHQIRAQLSSRDYIIAGDKKYGSRDEWESNAIALHAYMIRFIHPVKNEPVEIIAPPQNYFSTVLSSTFAINNNTELYECVVRAIDKKTNSQ
jgi:23S rRNA pseudouridine1911/1915/1917 synthase